MTKAPKISVVIPCYNHGVFLDEAVDSVLRQSLGDFEIVVVNDGSTDPFTVQLLQNYRRPKTRVVHTENNGLASARNTGIRNALGSYILPLDADDKIAQSYLEKAAAILDERPEAGVVYCDQELFGEKEGPWDAPPYDRTAMLFDNLVFATALFRKSDWERAGGYSPRFVYGLEDWDFWLSLTELGRGFVKIPKPLHFYRIRGGSMSRSMSFGGKLAMMLLLVARHRGLYLEALLREPGRFSRAWFGSLARVVARAARRK